MKKIITTNNSLHAWDVNAIFPSPVSACLSPFQHITKVYIKKAIGNIICISVKKLYIMILFKIMSLKL